MSILLAYLSTGKGTWGHVSRLMEGMDEEKWDKIILLTNSYGKKNFTSSHKVELIEINEGLGIEALRDDIKEKLKEMISGEVGVNFVSGTGKEHMALMSALMQLGVGFRLIALTNDGAKEL
jgi:hypothetical protein